MGLSISCLAMAEVCGCVDVANEAPDLVALGADSCAALLLIGSTFGTALTVNVEKNLTHNNPSMKVREQRDIGE